MRREYPEIGLLLEQEERGLKVSQEGDAYLAKNWRLSRDVIDILESAFEAGLTCLIQQRHPQTAKRYETGETVEYVSFSLSPTDYWVCAIDDQCARNNKLRDECERVIFKRSFRSLVRSADIDLVVEWRSPQNFFVDRSDFKSALRVTAPHFESLSKMRGSKLFKGKVPGFVDEDDIHSALLRHWPRLSLARLAENVTSEFVVSGGRIDLLASSPSNGNILVIEVKQVADEASIDQLERYLNAKEIRQLVTTGNGTLFGFLIAEDVKLQARRRAANSDFPISCFEAIWRQDGLDLSENLTLRNG